MCHAFFAGDYSAFTALYLDAPRMAPFLMDSLAEQVRRRGATAMVSAYMPSLPLDFVSLQLGLDSVEKVRNKRGLPAAPCIAGICLASM